MEHSVGPQQSTEYDRTANGDEGRCRTQSHTRLVETGQTDTDSDDDS